VFGLEGTKNKVRLQLKILAGRKWRDLERSLLLLEVNPASDHPFERTHEFRVAYHPTTTQLLEMSLAQPIRKSAEMIHVRVTQRNRPGAQGSSRALTHVKDDVEFWNLNDGLLAGDTHALNAVGRKVEKAELPFSGRHFGNHRGILLQQAFARLRVLLNPSS
jgi:hypothetical protein